MTIRLVLAVLLCWAAIAAGQVTGRFFLEKQTFAPGEPVFLYFETTNSGTEPQNVDHADPYAFCSGYSLRVSTDSPANLNCTPMIIAGSCLSSDYRLPPGKSRSERILLNYEHKIDAAGDYEVEAVKQLTSSPGNLYASGESNNSTEVRELLHFRVDENATPDGAYIQTIVQQLKSGDEAVRREAARELASLAPKSLEELLLSFAQNPEFREWAPLAFYRLNTPRSLDAIADLLRKTEAGTFVHTASASFLAKTGDPQWYPLLLEVAEKHANIADYDDDAAESGGGEVIPTLLAMMHSPDTEFVQGNAISALGFTGSRAAVPILLDLLHDPDPSTSLRALYGLRQLTHRTIPGERWFDNPQSQYPKWAQWWNREGANAPIYKAKECREMNLLP